MKKVFVIGAGTGQAAIEVAKKALEIKTDMEIICVESMEDIPIKDRFASDMRIQTIHKIEAMKQRSDLFFPKPEKKSHHRPYKYHK